MKSIFLIIAVFFIFLSIFYGLLNFFQIQTLFYFGEILIDTKIIILIGFVYFLQKRFSLDFRTILKDCYLWKSYINILFFFAVIIPLLITILLGNVLGFVEFNYLNNPESIFLGTVFDIPAIFIFSLTSVFVEELFFRVFLLKIFPTNSIVFQTISTSFFWMMYSIPELIKPELDIFALVISAVYFFCIGIFLSLLVRRFKTIWYGYSLRMGIISLVPNVLSSVVVESDSFFVSKNHLFSFEGVVTILILIGISFILFLKEKSTLKLQKTQF
jgi:hypothetical protein